MKAVWVNDIIEAAETYAAERISLANVRLEEVLDPMVGAVKADRTLLRYAFFSMIANAVNHLNGSGVVSIITESRTDGTVDVKVSTADGIEGRDGVLRVGGSNTRGNMNGLPLPVVRDIVEGQGGRMTWASNGKGGIGFTASFPGVCES